MAKSAKRIILAGSILALLVALSSCSSSRRLGCPMQITQHEQPHKLLC